MKIFDCFMYFDEDVVLELRLNYLNKYVDKFVIVESCYNHKGEKRTPQFNLDKFITFEDKIKYILIDKQPSDIEKIYENDESADGKFIMNACKRENFQRNYIEKGLEEASEDDWIIVSDLDEIPNLEKTDLKQKNSRLIFFKQKMMYYKFNLLLDDCHWIGSRACKKKNLKTPQWLRNIKSKIYPWWRLDIFFFENKYNKIEIIKDGGWHFSYIKNANDIEKKLKSYLHHREYEINPVGVEKIKEMIHQKKTIYNLQADMRSNKFDEGNKLRKIELNLLPNYISINKNKFSE